MRILRGLLVLIVVVHRRRGRCRGDVARVHRLQLFRRQARRAEAVGLERHDLGRSRQQRAGVRPGTRRAQMAAESQAAADRRRRRHAPEPRRRRGRCRRRYAARADAAKSASATARSVFRRVSPRPRSTFRNSICSATSTARSIRAQLNGVLLTNASGTLHWKNAAVSGAAQAQFGDLEANFPVMPPA